MVSAPRNPTWNRDELLLMLDFYLSKRPTIPSKSSADILALSRLLNRLGAKLRIAAPDKYRNANGVYMKLMNFRRFDPDYGGTGLTRGGKDEAVVWDLYFSKPQELRKIAATIRSFIESEVDVREPTAPLLRGDEEEEAEEGQVLTRLHRYRERDVGLAERKKAAVLRSLGHLKCEVCSFNFAESYGERGDGFIECHHTKPVSDLKIGDKTKLSELALVCANCHRMIHRQKPWLSLTELRNRIQQVAIPN